MRADGVVLALVGGALLGIVDRVISLGSPWMLDVANVGAIWLAAAFLAGRAAPGPAMGALLGIVTLMTAWCGYYGHMDVVEHQANAAYMEDIAVYWLYVSVACGGAFGALGALARGGARWPTLVLAASAAGEALILDVAGGHRPVVAVIELGVALGLAAAVVAGPRHLDTRTIEQSRRSP